MHASSIVAIADDIKLRIASGHPAVNTYVNLMQTFFVPEVSKRVAATTKHKIEFVEGYGGSMVKVADTLEGVQSGIIDIGDVSCLTISERSTVMGSATVRRVSVRSFDSVTTPLRMRPSLSVRMLMRKSALTTPLGSAMFSSR